MAAEPLLGSLRLKKNRERPLRQRHPWIYSGAVQDVAGDPNPGDLVLVRSAGGEPLALAFFNPASQIPGRVISWDVNRPIDRDFWRARLEAALALRRDLGLERQTDAFRLVFSEADGLPGLIVDAYAGHLVVQLSTAGMDVRRPLWIEFLSTLKLPGGGQPKSIFERADTSGRNKEGLPAQSEKLWGDDPPARVAIREHGLTYQVDVVSGHKTGFYLDQRENRRLLTDPVLVGGKKLLNVFAYTGGFAVAAAKGGVAHTLNIDTSVSALEQAEHHMLANFPERDGDEYLAGDAFDILRDFRAAGRTFDTIVLDPPKFAHGRADIPRASRGYKDINWLALQLLNPGGFLATFSCSGQITADLFQKILFGAALDAGREVQIIRPLAQAADHPIALNFPESAYLKGFLCRVSGADTTPNA